MPHTVKTTWKEKMAFDVELDNHVLRIDSRGEFGDDTGPGPKKLLLASLAGCTGIDIVSMLNKMRVPFKGLEIDTDADLTDDHPRVYSEIRLTYRVFGDNLDKKKVERAVELSYEKYCGVSAMLRKNSPIHYSIEYVAEDEVKSE